MQETFLYSVNPRKVITGIEGVGPIRTPKSLYLTKEDVKLCLSKGTVYRRFSLEGRNERVTIANVDRLHNSTYISEEEWKTKQFEAPKAPVVVEDDENNTSSEIKESNSTEDEAKNTESKSVDVTEEVTEVEETSEDPVDKDEKDVVENEVSENEDTVDQEPSKNEDGEDSVESEDETEVESDDEEVENE